MVRDQLTHDMGDGGPVYSTSVFGFITLFWTLVSNLHCVRVCVCVCVRTRVCVCLCYHTCGYQLETYVISLSRSRPDTPAHSGVGLLLPVPTSHVVHIAGVFRCGLSHTLLL